mmetsp:Transcript_41696/g.73878  ORF Transcript_41696/g.73878 Transcript_41696/m.73878 type:complete len:144 (-) Transcript_41696:181-612(-)
MEGGNHSQEESPSARRASAGSGRLAGGRTLRPMAGGLGSIVQFNVSGLEDALATIQDTLQDHDLRLSQTPPWLQDVLAKLDRLEQLEARVAYLEEEEEEEATDAPASYVPMEMVPLSMLVEGDEGEVFVVEEVVEDKEQHFFS